MKKLDDIDKEIIRSIDKVCQSNIGKISNVIASFFKENQSALLIHDDIYLLTVDDMFSSKMFLSMVKIVSLIDSLQKNGYIYLIPNKESFFLQNGCDSSITISTQGEISCHLGIIERDSHDMIKLTTKGKSYRSVEISKEFRLALKQTICNFVYPSPKLHELIKNNFVFDEELRYKNELKYTKIGLGISIFALLLSIGSEYNNKHAITTIDSIQIQKIENAILDHTKRDSIYIQSIKESEAKKYEKDSPVKRKFLNKSKKI